MRNLKKLSIAVLVLFVSCTTQKGEGDDTGNGLSEELTPAAVAEQLHGHWYGEDYLNTIQKTKSIFASRQYSTIVFGFVLDKDDLLGNEPFFNGFSDHEGGYSAYLKFDPEKHCFVHDLTKKPEYTPIQDAFELHLKNGDRVELYFPDSRKTENYRKVTPDIQSELRKLLFTGEYRNTTDNSRVTFSDDGKVANWDNYSYYELMSDFIEGFDYDVIILYTVADYESGEGGQYFTYRITQNTIELTTIRPDWDYMAHEITNEKTVLKKI